jgi:hypothetical protein
MHKLNRATVRLHNFVVARRKHGQIVFAAVKRRFGRAAADQRDGMLKFAC